MGNSLRRCEALLAEVLQWRHPKLLLAAAKAQQQRQPSPTTKAATTAQSAQSVQSAQAAESAQSAQAPQGPHSTESTESAESSAETADATSLSLAIRCCDCSQMNRSLGAGFSARAYFSAAHVEDAAPSERPTVNLCVENLRGGRAEVAEALVHEMVHAYDHCARGRDLTACEQLACSEVRAAREAECRATFGGGAGQLWCTLAGADPEAGPDLEAGSVCGWFQKRCAKATARSSTEAVFPGRGAACVDAVFERCFRDLAPFAPFERNPSDQQDK